MAYRIAIGTVDGIEVTEHFGEGKNFLIVEIDHISDEVKKLANIGVTHSEHGCMGHDENLIQEKIQGFLEWNVKAILVKQIGPRSERIMTKNKIDVLLRSGKIEEALEKIKKFYKRRHFTN